MPYPLYHPPLFRDLYANANFLQNIRDYNSMFAMTSLGAVVDEDINKGPGPNVFKVFGQISH